MMRKKNLSIAFCCLALSVLLLAEFISSPVFAGNPLVTDSRIRTFVYGENEVFSIFTKFGYQTNIEFGKSEKIITVSMGDSSAFKITPSGNRLFIKAMQPNKLTNMTLITNKRAYQFDLSSIIKDDRDIMYVVRFFYPTKDFDDSANHSLDNIVLKDFVSAPEPNVSSPPRPVVKTAGNFNFNYSLTGPDHFAPLKIYDDGRSTYFKLPNNGGASPSVNSVSAEGIESPLVARTQGEYMVVDLVSSVFSLRLGPDVVCVFNDGFSRKTSLR